MIDVLAPGSYVFGEWLFGHGYSEGRNVAFSDVDNFIFGTSFAAPHVVGIVARMLQKNPFLTQSDVETLLKTTALPIPPSPGFGFYPGWDARATGAGLAQGARRWPRLRCHHSSRPACDPAAPRRWPAPPSASSPAVCRWSSGSRDSATSRTRCGCFDVQGRLVRHWPSSTSVRETWDGARDDGTAAPSGVYFVVAKGGGLQRSAKLVLAR
jgi:hypothetical protein